LRQLIIEDFILISEITINDILGQTHLYDYDRQMMIVGKGCSCRAEAPSFMENWTFGEESQELGADPEDPKATEDGA